MTKQRPETPKESPLDAPLLTFNLPTLAQQIRNGESWHKGERNAMPLFKAERMRVVLMALHAGAAISSHRADGPITVHVLEGRIRFSAESQTVTLTKGQMLSLQSGLPHAVEAPEESVFLLTVAPIPPAAPQA